MKRLALCICGLILFAMPILAENRSGTHCDKISEIPQVYRDRAQTWNFGRVKAPGIDARKRVHIVNIEPVESVDSRELSRDPNSKFEPDRGITIPEFESLKRIENVSQNGLADWSGMVGIAKGISCSEAMWIASQNPEITFFFYTKGLEMILGSAEAGYRLFRHGDAVFFCGEPCWSSAEGLSDGYIKQ
jgi:hypothetical protein